MRSESQEEDFVSSNSSHTDVDCGSYFILNLKRVANLGMLWLNAPLLVIGIGLIVAREPTQLSLTSHAGHRPRNRLRPVKSRGLSTE